MSPTWRIRNWVRTRSSCEPEPPALNPFDWKVLGLSGRRLSRPFPARAVLGPGGRRRSRGPGRDRLPARRRGHRLRSRGSHPVGDPRRVCLGPGALRSAQASGAAVGGGGCPAPLGADGVSVGPRRPCPRPGPHGARARGIGWGRLLRRAACGKLRGPRDRLRQPSNHEYLRGSRGAGPLRTSTGRRRPGTRPRRGRRRHHLVGGQPSTPCRRSSRRAASSSGSRTPSG